jgi:NADH dehydrogenase FAD-containing subunit
VLIVGGGAGGSELAVSLARKSRKTALNCHLREPRLHEVAVGLEVGSREGLPFLQLAQEAGFHFAMGALTAVNPAAKTSS